MGKKLAIFLAEMNIAHGNCKKLTDLASFYGSEKYF